MKTIYITLSLIILSGCAKLEIPEESAEVKQLKLEEEKRFNAGPKYRAGCYKVVNKNNSDYGCTFLSRQGSSFFSEDGRIPYSGKWHLTVNKKIRCLSDIHLIDEDDAKPIKCPERFYYE